MVANPGAGTANRVAVIGAGSWGTALAIVAARNHLDVKLWAREPEVAVEINRTRRNPFYLSDFELSENIRATTAVEDAIEGADFALLVVPSHAMREMATRLRPHLKSETLLVSAAKGVENSTLMRMEEVVADVLRESFDLDTWRCQGRALRLKWQETIRRQLSPQAETGNGASSYSAR
jgi:glycerol-3-phosphate dehydrogenase (NAD(P)+)